MIRRSSRAAVRCGDERGRDERASIGSPAANRRDQRETVAGEHWNRSATRRTGQPCSTTSRATLILVASESATLAWPMKTSV
jgi:hypothetical protein